MDSIESHLRVQLSNLDMTEDLADAEEIVAGFFSLVLSDPHTLLDKRDDVNNHSWLTDLWSSGEIYRYPLLLLTIALYNHSRIRASVEHPFFQIQWYPLLDTPTDTQSARLYLQFLALGTYGMDLGSEVYILNRIFGIIQKNSITFDTGILSLLAMIAARCITNP